MMLYKLDEKQRIKFLSFTDYFIFSALVSLLSLLIFFQGSANIHHDSGDYYTILQKLTDSSKKPAIPNTHFVEQRSPGYSIISTVPYYIIYYAIDPFVKTEKIIDKGAVPPRLPRVPQGSENNGKENINKPLSGGGPGMGGIPSAPLLAKDIFFKNYYIENADAWFEWKIIFAMLLTSYIFLFLGIIFSIKTLMLKREEITGFSLPMLVIATSIIFVINIIITPSYATLTAFGLSSIFCFYYIKSFEQESFKTQFLAGLFLGLLVLTRLETVLIAGILFIFLVFNKKWGFIKNLLLGSSISLAILLLYNLFQFGTPFHFGILKGDINKIGFNLGYLYDNLFNPKSGILFWSFFISVGLSGLFLGKEKHLKALGIASLTVIALLLVRVPIMYNCIGGEPVNLGGIFVDCARNKSDALMLVWSDANRYMTVLAPFAIIGLQRLLMSTVNLKRKSI